MQEIDNYEWTEYYILPVHKKVRFIPIKTKEKFEVIIKDYQGQNVKVEFSELQKPENEKLRWGLLHVHFLKIKFFLLSNGMIAVDRNEQTKATPYFICSSIDDFRLIADYLLMYFINDGSFIIECRIDFDQFAIKRFLEKEPLELIKERSDSIYLLFKTDIGKYARVAYFDKNDGIPSGFDSYVRNNLELQNEEIVYYHLIIYDSLEVMNKLGVFDNDYFEINEENFTSHKKKLFISNKKFIRTLVLNQNEALSIIKNVVKIIPEKFGPSYHTVVLNEGKIIAQYSPYIYLQFENEFDFRHYLSHLKTELGENHEAEPQFEYFSEKIRQDINQKVIYDSLFEVDTTDNTLEQSLKLLDKKMNKFFFDNSLIKRYSAELAVRIGNLIIDKEGGDWKYDEDAGRMVIVTGSNTRLDFTLHLYKELLRQKYTGFCPTSAMITGLFIGPRINIKRFDPQQN